MLCLLHCWPVSQPSLSSLIVFQSISPLPSNTQRVKKGGRWRGAINSEALSALFTLSARSQKLPRLWEYIDVNGIDNGLRKQCKEIGAGEILTQMAEGLATRQSVSNFGDSTDAPRDAFVVLSESITDDIAVIFNNEAEIDALHSEARRWLPSLSNMLAIVQVGANDENKLSFELGRLNRKPLQAWLGRLETADPTKSNKTKMFTGPFTPPFLSTSGTPVPFTHDVLRHYVSNRICERGC